MKPVSARVRKSGDYDSEAVTLERASGPTLRQARVVPALVVEAARQAEAIVQNAQERAHDMIEQAKRAVAQVRLEAEAQGRADGAAALAAQALALRSRELKAAERDLERQIELSRLLAERLLGEELRLDPARVGALARQALSEARGALQIRIEAHPLDAQILRPMLDSLGIENGTAQVADNPERDRGNLKIVTEFGTLDAALSPQLEQLARELYATLRDDTSAHE